MYIHFEERILILLERLCFDLFGELDYGLKLGVVLLLLQIAVHVSSRPWVTEVAHDLAFASIAARGRLTALLDAGVLTRGARASEGLDMVS